MGTLCRGVIVNKLVLLSSGITANVLDYDIVVSEFELQSRYCVHFLTNTLEKCMNS